MKKVQQKTAKRTKAKAPVTGSAAHDGDRQPARVSVPVETLLEAIVPSRGEDCTNPAAVALDYFADEVRDIGYALEYSLDNDTGASLRDDAIKTCDALFRLRRRVAAAVALLGELDMDLPRAQADDEAEAVAS